MNATPIELSGFEIFCAYFLVAVAIVTAVLYAIRTRLRGRVRYDRVTKQGGSRFLNEELMHMAYWAMQPFARAMVFLRITPNMMSWTSLITGMAAAVALAQGRFGVGAVFAFVSAVLDSLDGLVARMLGTQSDVGEVLDASIDRYVEFAFTGAMVYYYRDYPTFMILALVALAACFMVSYSSAKAEAMHVELHKGGMRRPERAVYLILGASLSPFSIKYLEAGNAMPVAYPMVLGLAIVAAGGHFSAIARLVEIAVAIRKRDKQPAPSLSDDSQLVYDFKARR